MKPAMDQLTSDHKNTDGILVASIVCDKELAQSDGTFVIVLIIRCCVAPRKLHQRSKLESGGVRTPVAHIEALVFSQHFGYRDWMKNNVCAMPLPSCCCSCQENHQKSETGSDESLVWNEMQ